jgi:hypothetical protein
MKQSEVWARISQYQHDLAASSPTDALEDAFESRAVDVRALVEGTRPLPEQRGVAVAIGGALRALDCFDKPETLAVYWDALTAGYALDAVAATVATVAPAGAPPVGVVEQLAARVAAATRTPVTTAGLGEAATFTGNGVVGTELRWKGAGVHISAFVDETVRSPEPDAAPIRRRARRSS